MNNLATRGKAAGGPGQLTMKGLTAIQTGDVICEPQIIPTPPVDERHIPIITYKRNTTKIVKIEPSSILIRVTSVSVDASVRVVVNNLDLNKILKGTVKFVNFDTNPKALFMSSDITHEVIKPIMQSSAITSNLVKEEIDDTKILNYNEDEITDEESQMELVLDE